MNGLNCISFLIAILAVLLLYSSEGQATNGHQLSAIGAYQQGMAGAVTAAPFDTSTAITNPAGMAIIGSRTDFSFEGFFPRREISFANTETSLSGSRFYLVPAMGWTAPVDRLGDVYFGGGMYGVSGMGVDYTDSERTVHGSRAGRALYSRNRQGRHFFSISILENGPYAGFQIRLFCSRNCFKSRLSGIWF